MNRIQKKNIKQSTDLMGEKTTDLNIIEPNSSQIDRNDRTLINTQKTHKKIEKKIEIQPIVWNRENL